MRSSTLVRAALCTFCCGLLAVPAFALEPGQSTPKRLYSIGDSITRAFDADLPADNLNLSWVNGYFGFWQWLFGLPNVRAHNQRISANFGSSGRKNWIAAQNGARVDDLVSQAGSAAGKNVTYSTVMLGGNDVCRDSIADLPTDAEFEANVVAGMDTLLGNLPNGATVQVVAIPDLKRLYDIGQDKTALGIVDCEVLWALTVAGFPCGSMLSPFNSEADRLYVQSRIIGYNQILENITDEKADQHPGKFLSYTDVTFSEPFQEEDISDIDCYHPSWRGERKFSEHTWNDGFFSPYQLGN
jgi:lysophospholipase L1-like esterase